MTGLGLILVGLLAGQPQSDPSMGHLWVPSESAAYRRMDPMEYHPMEGDIFFFTDEKWARRVIFWFAGTGRPYHVGLVVKDEHGKLSTLEARPHSESWVFLLDLKERMTTYHGSIWVRRLRKPITIDESKRLTQFAHSQQGKPFAMVRLAFEGTPLNVRAGLGQFLFASQGTEKTNWFCSELTTAALIECGVFEGRGLKPNRVYPRDLFYDRAFKVGDIYEAPLLWGPSLDEGPPPPRLVGLPTPEPITTLGPARRLPTAIVENPGDKSPLPDSSHYIGEEVPNDQGLENERAKRHREISPPMVVPSGNRGTSAPRARNR